MKPSVPSVPCWNPSDDSSLDPRTHAFRPEIAGAALRCRVNSANFAGPIVHECNVERATVYVSPELRSEACSELLFGNRFHAVASEPNWLWGWCGHDHYIGYVRSSAFERSVRPPTHHVIARNGLRFDAPSIKSQVRGRLPLGALLGLNEAEGLFLSDDKGGFVHRRHVAPIGDYASDPVDAALRLLGAPYLWGGRTGEGIDCSGLVQIALGLCGIAAPRDCDQQMAALGEEIDLAEAGPGDLVFFPGHVGMMVDATGLLHANAFWMTTLVEPLADVLARLAPLHERPVLAVKRI